MPGEYFYLMLLSFQRALYVVAMILAIGCISSGKLFDAFCYVMTNFLLWSAACFVHKEVNYYRFCCVPRQITGVSLIFLLTVPPCCALFGNFIVVTICAAVAGNFIMIIDVVL